jgi:muconolactone delta-isomerase
VEFLVEFEVHVPDGAPACEVGQRTSAEASAAARLVDEGHLVRLWKPSAAAPEAPTALGLYRADSEAQLAGLLAALPLYDWMDVTVTALEPHPSDPVSGATVPAGTGRLAMSSGRLPDPRLTPIYRLEATLGPPLDLGEGTLGHRRIVPLTGGAFTGPELCGELLSGTSADWQTVLPDGTALGDIRYTLQTDRGELLYVESRGVRHGSAEVLARLGRGEDVDAREYTFRTSTRIEAAARPLDWLNRGVFISVGGRQASGVTYEVYLVE